MPIFFIYRYLYENYQNHGIDVLYFILLFQYNLNGPLICVMESHYLYARVDELFLREYMARALGLRPPPKQVLSTVNLEGVAKLILEGKVKKVITMAGAGISTCEYLYIFE